MAIQQDQERTVLERIERLRLRLDRAKTFDELRGVLKGMLDLLADQS